MHLVEKRLWTHLWRMRSAYLVLLLALIPTVLMFLRLRANLRTHDQLRFERLMTRAQSGIDHRVVRCVDQMYNLRALFAASDSVSRNEWDRYITTLPVPQEDLGIRSLGYLERVPLAARDEFLQRRSADTGPDFAITPKGERPVYYPVVDLTIFGPGGEIVPGLDHGSQAQRRETIERAIDENKPFATAKVDFLSPFVGPEGHLTNSCVALYLPVYRNGSEIKTVEQRRAAAQG